MTDQTVLGMTAAASSAPSIRAHSRRNRVFLFWDFLLRTYPNISTPRDVKFSNDDSRPIFTVLDVAGGKGNLSWLLSNVKNNSQELAVESFIFDPRCAVDHAHLEKSLRYLRNHPDEAKIRASPGRPTYQPLASLLDRLPEFPNRPRHVRVHVDTAMVQAVREEMKRNKSMELDRSCSLGHGWSLYFKEATARAYDASTLPPVKQSGTEESSPSSSCTSPSSLITSASEVLNIVKRASLVVGFHPDQATEACIDLANALKIPYAIVPCCVFPSEFPSRHLSDGRRVVRYPEFIEYLREKHPNARIAHLPFDKATTRGTVLYTLPVDVESTTVSVKCPRVP